MSSYSKSFCFGVLSVALWTAAAHAIEIDSTSNDVFDLYFFGNNEVGQIGENLYGFKDSKTGLDLQEISGWVDWTEGETSTPRSYWTEDRKSAMVKAVGAWTDIIKNVYNGDRKMRIGFFLDDGLRDGSAMDIGMTGYASYASTTIDAAGTNPTNCFSVPEWLWRDGKSSTVAPPESMTSGAFWNNNLLPSKENCIEVAIVLNPETWVLSNSAYVVEETSEETLKMVAMHELGHALGVDSKIFDASGTFTKLATTWDSLLMLGDDQRIVTLNNDGTLACEYDSFQELCRAGWSIYEQWLVGKSGKESLLRIQNADGESALVLVTAGENIAGNSLIHLLGDPESDAHYEVLGPTGLQGDEFTEIDLAAMRALGWQVVPEPSMFGCLAGVIALIFAGTRRNRLRRS